MRELYLAVRKLEGGAALVRFLNSRKNSVLTIDDIAYHLQQAEPVVEHNLSSLVELGWARRIDSRELCWYGLARDPQRQRIVQALVAWEDQWLGHPNDLENLIMDS